MKNYKDKEISIKQKQKRNSERMEYNEQRKRDMNPCLG